MRSNQGGHVIIMCPFCVRDDFMNPKPFKTIDQQINILKSRGLLIQNEEAAKNNLRRYGYYEIINGYKDCFLDSSNDNKTETFKPNVTFEHIFALFTLDRNLRTQVMSALEIFESNLRQAVAYTVAEKYTELQSNYLKRSNYRTGKKQYYRSLGRKAYPIDVLLDVLKRVTHSNAEPFKHYRDNHGNIPPWIIVKKLNFGNLIWWYQLLKGNEKRNVISIMTGLDPILIEQLPDFETGYTSLLSLYLDYRNTAAHGGRIYNHFSKVHELPYNKVIHTLMNISPADYRNNKGKSRLGTLAKTLNIASNKTPYNELRIGLDIYINQYLELYPDEKTYLCHQMELSTDYLNQDFLKKR